MTYIFPHETLFIWVTGLLIIGLLGLRVALTLKRRRQPPDNDRTIQEP